MLNLLKFDKNRFGAGLDQPQSEKTRNIALSEIRKGDDAYVNRHFPSSTKSWFNSIYSYDKNVVKSMPFLDKIVNNLIRMYFNLNSNVNLNKKFTRRRTKERRLSTKKIFVSKAEIKHSNDKVIITLYTYNRTKKYLKKRLSKLYRRIFSYTYIPYWLLKQIILNIRRFNFELSHEEKKNLKNIFFNPKRKIKKFKHLKREYRWNKKYKKYARLFLYRYFSNLYKNVLAHNTYDYLVYLKFKSISRRGSVIFDKFLYRSKYILKILKDKKLHHPNVIKMVKGKKLPFVFKLKNLKTFNKYNNEYYNTYIKETLRKEMLYLNYNQLLKIDDHKFNNIYLSRLNNIIGNIYKKKIEFNIINLKYVHLDSRIFSESIALKIRNRKNKLIRILKKALKIKRPNRAKRYKYNVQKLYIDKYNKSNKNVFYTMSDFATKDVLHSLLDKIFNIKNVSCSLKDKVLINMCGRRSPATPATPALIIPTSLSKEKYIYKSIRFRKIRGVRLEAKGRLTRRLTASRAIFKLRYKGSLKNLDSSINGLSSVILRGSLKSNIDYVNLNSKTRNGCFGLKGWISSK